MERGKTKRKNEDQVAWRVTRGALSRGWLTSSRPADRLVWKKKRAE